MSAQKKLKTDLYLMNADGSNRTHITGMPDNIDTPVWSPDSSLIAFTSLTATTGGHYQVSIMNSDGTGLRRITHSSSDDAEPAWSPDGKHIAFSSQQTGSSREDIYVMDMDGGNRTQLTHGIGKSFAPAWSPDGKYIAFTWERGVLSGWEIWKMKADGTEQTQLTHASSSSDVFLDTAARWSPDGEYIVFQTQRNSDVSEIDIVKADGSEFYRLASDASAPTWSP